MASEAVLWLNNGEFRGDVGPVHIFGTSGFARETADVAEALGLEAVFIAASSDEWDACNVAGLSVIMEDEIPEEGQFAIGIGGNEARRKIAERHAGLDFVNMIHPDASFGRRQHEAFERRKGVIVCAGVRFTNNIEVGDFTIFNLNATIGHDCVIEDFVNIAPGANVSGNVHIRQGAWIGTGASINQGSDERKLEIGARTMIGSGSVVVSDCEADSVYVGVPAKRRCG